MNKVLEQSLDALVKRCVCACLQEGKLKFTSMLELIQFLDE